jgi:hypothetical protein
MALEPSRVLQTKIQQVKDIRFGIGLANISHPDSNAAEAWRDSQAISCW